EEATWGVGAGDTATGHLKMGALAGAMTSAIGAFGRSMRPGVKGLLPSGEVAVQVPIVNTNPLADSTAHEQPPRLIDVLTATRRSAPVYKVLRQTSPADPGGAGVVAPGDVKPSLKLGLTTDDARLRVI